MPAFSRPAGLVKVARAMRPRAILDSLVKDPIRVPSLAMEKDSRVPALRPFWRCLTALPCRILVTTGFVIA